MKHLEFIKNNQTLNKSNLSGSNYYYENQNLLGPKILLAEGWSKVLEFVEYLRSLKPLKPLEYNHRLCLAVPKSKADWTNREVFMKLISDKKEELNYRKIFFHFDIGYLDAETSAILQLVDDNTGFNGSRRRNILNPHVVQVGISNLVNGLKNCTYVLFYRNENNNNDNKHDDTSNNIKNSNTNKSSHNI